MTWLQSPTACSLFSRIGRYIHLAATISGPSKAKGIRSFRRFRASVDRPIHTATTRCHAGVTFHLSRNLACRPPLLCQQTHTRWLVPFRYDLKDSCGTREPCDQLLRVSIARCIECDSQSKSTQICPKSEKDGSCCPELWRFRIRFRPLMLCAKAILLVFDR
jgi:hypothetical protein